MSLLVLGSGPNQDPANFRCQTSQPLIIQPNSQVCLVSLSHDRKNTLYKVVENENDTLCFAIGSPPQNALRTAVLTDGSYTGAELAAEIAAALNRVTQQRSWEWTCTFTASSASEPDQFTIALAQTGTASPDSGGDWTDGGGQYTVTKTALQTTIQPKTVGVARARPSYETKGIFTDTGAVSFSGVRVDINPTDPDATQGSTWVGLNRYGTISAEEFDQSKMDFAVHFSSDGTDSSIAVYRRDRGGSGERVRILPPAVCNTIITDVIDHEVAVAFTVVPTNSEVVVQLQTRKAGGSYSFVSDGQGTDDNSNPYVSTQEVAGISYPGVIWRSGVGATYDTGRSISNVLWTSVFPLLPSVVVEQPALRSVAEIDLSSATAPWKLTTDSGVTDRVMTCTSNNKFVAADRDGLGGYMEIDLTPSGIDFSGSAKGAPNLASPSTWTYTSAPPGSVTSDASITASSDPAADWELQIEGEPTIYMVHRPQDGVFGVRTVYSLRATPSGAQTGLAYYLYSIGRLEVGAGHSLEGELNPSSTPTQDADEAVTVRVSSLNSGGTFVLAGVGNTSNLTFTLTTDSAVTITAQENPISVDGDFNESRRDPPSPALVGASDDVNQPVQTLVFGSDVGAENTLGFGPATHTYASSASAGATVQSDGHVDASDPSFESSPPSSAETTTYDHYYSKDGGPYVLGSTAPFPGVQTFSTQRFFEHSVTISGLVPGQRYALQPLFSDLDEHDQGMVVPAYGTVKVSTTADGLNPPLEKIKIRVNNVLVGNVKALKGGSVSQSVAGEFYSTADVSGNILVEASQEHGWYMLGGVAQRSSQPGVRLERIIVTPFQLSSSDTTRKALMLFNKLTEADIASITPAVAWEADGGLRSHKANSGKLLGFPRFIEEKTPAASHNFESTEEPIKLANHGTLCVSIQELPVETVDGTRGDVSRDLAILTRDQFSAVGGLQHHNAPWPNFLSLNNPSQLVLNQLSVQLRGDNGVILDDLQPETTLVVKIQKDPAIMQRESTERLIKALGKNQPQQAANVATNVGS